MYLFYLFMSEYSSRSFVLTTANTQYAYMYLLHAFCFCFHSLVAILVFDTRTITLSRNTCTETACTNIHTIYMYMNYSYETRITWPIKIFAIYTACNWILIYILQLKDITTQIKTFHQQNIFYRKCFSTGFGKFYFILVSTSGKKNVHCTSYLNYLYSKSVY